MTAGDHSDEVLRVYRSRAPGGGFWHPEHGDLAGPREWEFIPSGNAFITRKVKRLGHHWALVKYRKGYTATPGLLAPSVNV